MDPETKNRKLSIPAIISINKKQYNGLIEANEKGLYFLSNHEINSVFYPVDWESLKITQSNEQIRKHLFFKVSMIGILVTSEYGSLPKILIDESDCTFFIRELDNIATDIRRQKEITRRAKEWEITKGRIEENRRRIRERVQIERNERHARLNKLLEEAEKEHQYKLYVEAEKQRIEEEKRKESISRLIILLKEEADNNEKLRAQALERLIRLLVIVSNDKAEQERIIKNKEIFNQAEWDKTKKSLEEYKKCLRERQKMEQEERHMRLGVLLIKAEEIKKEKEELRRREEEQRRQEELQRKKEEERKREEIRRRLEEGRRWQEEFMRELEEEKKRDEERLRLEQERRRQEELRREKEEERKREEERLRLEKERRKQEEFRRKLEEERKREEERLRLEEERRRQEELRRKKAEERRRKEELNGHRRDNHTQVIFEPVIEDELQRRG